ncbi:MAG TPA: universal stress protein [Cyclobacteriaceae bacterium]|nr:universal stress protein [Cyclobacteriaceae bacterium]HRJ81538.1 universal stress protein [Cyclobacteriaceae bacterium]
MKESIERVQLNRLDHAVDRTYKQLQLKRSKTKIQIMASHNIFAAEEILLNAKKLKAGLIIIGTHGATGMKFLGSTTTHLINNSPKPVLAIPPKYCFKKIRTIVYASDLENTLDELKQLTVIAKTVKAKVEALHLLTGENEQESKAKLITAIKRAGYKNIKAVIEIEKPDLTILEHLNAYLRRTKPQMFVMFPQERSLFDKLFVRGKTEELAYTTKLPMLTIKKNSRIERNPDLRPGLF